MDEVIAAIRSMLGTNGWNAGTRLPSEHQLSEQLGVGRSTVREALRVLGHLGLVESRSGLGTFVVKSGIPPGDVEFPSTPEALRELFEFRRHLESAAARLAAERRTEAELQLIETAWRACEPAVDEGSALRFAQLDYVFHLRIVEAGHNRMFVEAFRNIERPFVGNVEIMLGLGPLTSMLHFHDGLIDAIRQQDAEAAARAVEENFVETDIRQRLFAAGNESLSRAVKSGA